MYRSASSPSIRSLTEPSVCDITPQRPFWRLAGWVGVLGSGERCLMTFSPIAATRGGKTSRGMMGNDVGDGR